MCRIHSRQSAGLAGALEQGIECLSRPADKLYLNDPNGCFNLSFKHPEDGRGWERLGSVDWRRYRTAFLRVPSPVNP